MLWETLDVRDYQSVLLGHPNIKDVAIIGVPDERLGEVAATIVEPGNSLTEEDS